MMDKIGNGCLILPPRLPEVPHQYDIKCPSCHKSYVVLDRIGSLITPCPSTITCPYCDFREKTQIEKTVDKLLKVILWPF